ncbi:flagellar hook-associated protein FlgL [Oscillospiraceae bacterium WX1]
MRITNAMMAGKFLSESNDALNRVSKYQSQVDTSKKISGISDDPHATLATLRARNRLTNLALYQSNIQTASSYLTEAESVANELNEIIQSAYGDIITANDGSKTQSELSAISEDLKNLRNEVLSIGNTTLGTSYIFGGFNYTGSTNGVTKTPPFSTSSATGDVLYNGINLSQVAWKDDFDNGVSVMTNLQGKANAIIAAFSTTASDSYNLTQATTALGDLNDLVTAGNTALNAAKSFGADPASAEYTGLKTVIDGLAGIAADLYTETSKELAADPADTTNKFSATAVQTLLNNAAAYLTDPGTGSALDNAMAQLGTVVTIPAATQAAMTAEAANRTTMQIGTSQTIDMTLTGLDLFGTGKDNIYHVLTKCIKMLDGGMTPDLDGMTTALQSAQSSVLNLQTKIGASQNRLTLVGSRYQTNELNYTKMRSDAEDADMAETAMNLATAQSVYNAALAGGAKILQTSLIDFLK